MKFKCQNCNTMMDWEQTYQNEEGQHVCEACGLAEQEQEDELDQKKAELKKRWPTNLLRDLLKDGDFTPENKSYETAMREIANGDELIGIEGSHTKWGFYDDKPVTVWLIWQHKTWEILSIQEDE